MEKNYLSRLIIGSAQFGFDYGVTNHEGMVPGAEVQKILEYAYQNQMITIDTASLYGKSEDVLGEYGKNRFDIITKFSKIPKEASAQETEKLIRESLDCSFKRLDVKKIHALLVHDVNEFFAHSGAIIETGKKLKEEGLIQKFGVSLYTPEQMAKVLDLFLPDVIQFPMNILDQRFIDSGILKICSERGVELHVRSVFLQGIILQKSSQLDPFFDFFKSFYQNYESFIEEQGLNHLASALKFILDNPHVAKVIVGVCSTEQLKEIHAALNLAEKAKTLDFSSWKFHDERLINPLMWPMLKK